ncbi:MAG TPA: energy transducer TonB [Candidatus Limnocylindrales bacterium]|nr:energy transducer TonB [Candidatus Limnocylindrales bacterium]
MSEPGGLSQCLVDFDVEARERARKLRRKALALSLVLEALLVAAMLIWPLITPGVLPRQYVVDPIPPMGGIGKTGKSHPAKPLHPPPTQMWRSPTVCIVCAPPINPAHPDTSGDVLPPDISGGNAGGGGNDFSTGDGGPGVPGSTGRGNPLDVLRRHEEPPPPGPVKMSQGVMEASLIHRVQPEYPAIARVARISGRVELRAIIGTDGSVRHIEIVSGNPLLVQAAVAAVRQWRYRPTLLSGEPVEVDALITVDFRLQ